MIIGKNIIFYIMKVVCKVFQLTVPRTNTIEVYLIVLIKMLKTFGANRFQIFLKVVLPYNIETLFSSLKINLGLSLVGVIAGEFLVSKAGLGYLIVYGGQVFKMDLVMASVIILAIAAAILYELIVISQKLVLKILNHQ